MRKIKLIAFLTSVASCLVLFGVGYSSWYNVQPIAAQTKSGSFETYGVLDISVEEMTLFKFSMLSFKTGDAKDSIFKDSDTGEITVTYKIDTATLAQTGGKFTVNLSLGYDATTVVGGKADLFGFLATSGDSNTVTVASNKGTLGTTTVSNGAEITNVCTFENVSTTADFTFTVTYTFNIPKAENNFLTNFGKHLKGADTSGVTVTKFIASAHVSA